MTICGLGSGQREPSLPACQDAASAYPLSPLFVSRVGQPPEPPMSMVGGIDTGGPVWNCCPVSIGTITTRSIDGFSSPPNADQTSAKARSSGGGSAMVIGTGRPSSVSGPVSTLSGSAS